jgi:hypothetical protein
MENAAFFLVHGLYSNHRCTEPSHCPRCAAAAPCTHVVLSPGALRRTAASALALKVEAEPPRAPHFPLCRTRSRSLFAPESTLPWPLWSSRAPSYHSPPSNYLHPLARAVIHGGRASRARSSASRTSLSKVRVYLPAQLSCEFYISIISTWIP